MPALCLYLLAWFRLGLEELPKQRIEFFFLYLHAGDVNILAGPEGFGPSERALTRFTGL